MISVYLSANKYLLSLLCSSILFVYVRSEQIKTIKKQEQQLMKINKKYLTKNSLESIWTISFIFTLIRIFLETLINIFSSTRQSQDEKKNTNVVIKWLLTYNEPSRVGDTDFTSMG